MQKKYDQLILTGSISIDRIMNFSGRYEDIIQPDKLHVLSIAPLVDSLQHTRGGVAANIAYNLALLKDCPTLLASVGEDGQAYMQDLLEMGVDTSHLHYSPLPTSSFTVMTDANDCQVGGFYPGAMSDSDTLSLAPWYGTNSLFVLSPYDPKSMSRLVKEAYEHHLPLVYDIGQQVTIVPPEELLLGIKSSELLILNDYELGILAKRTMLSEAKIKSLVPLIITTLGERGSIIEGGSLSSPLKIPAVKTNDVVDPTGAGDAYRGGFLYGYSRGWSLITCAQIGSVAASFAIAKRGTQEHHFTLADIKEKLYTAYGVKI